MNTAHHIIAAIDSIASVDQPDSLQKIQQALDTLFTSPHPEIGIDALFRVLERFPDSDGFGVFWSILHGLEALPNYETRLIQSVQQQPMEFNLIMINRLLNAGVDEINGVNLVALLDTIADTPIHRQRARELARNFAERHRTDEG